MSRKGQGPTTDIVAGPLFFFYSLLPIPLLVDAEAFSHEALEAGAPDEVVGEVFAGEHGKRGGASVGDHLRGLVDGERAVLRDGLLDEVHHHLEAAEEAGFGEGFGGARGCGGEWGGSFGKGERDWASTPPAKVLPLGCCGLRGDSAVGGEEEGDETGAVGAPGLRVGGFEAGEDVGAGVAEGVVAANADDGLLWCDGVEELGVGGGLAAVVADLE